MLWKLCFTTTEKLLAWCGFWGFWHLGRSNHPAMAPLFTVDLKRVYISRQLHMILEVVHVHPFPTLPWQSCSWGFSDVEMSWVVFLMSHQRKILHFLLHPMIVNIIHKCLIHQCQL
jgi:hypothetical protein